MLRLGQFSYEEAEFLHRRKTSFSFLIYTLNFLQLCLFKHMGQTNTVWTVTYSKKIQNILEFLRHLQTGHFTANVSLPCHLKFPVVWFLFSTKFIRFLCTLLKSVWIVIFWLQPPTLCEWESMPYTLLYYWLPITCLTHVSIIFKTLYMFSSSIFYFCFSHLSYFRFASLCCSAISLSSFRHREASFLPPSVVLSVFTARAYARAVLSHNSVCPSVTRVDCNKSKWCTIDILIPHKRAITLLLWHQQRLVGDAPSLWNLRTKWPTRLRKTLTLTDFRL